MEIIKVRKTTRIKKSICKAELKIASENLIKMRKKYDEITFKCEDKMIMKVNMECLK